jgi:hypothetical protein
MYEDEFARYLERARQFADGYEWIVFGINHSQQTGRRSVHPTFNRAKGPPRPLFIGRIYLTNLQDLSAPGNAGRSASLMLVRFDHQAARGGRFRLISNAEPGSAIARAESERGSDSRLDQRRALV